MVCICEFSSSGAVSNVPCSLQANRHSLKGYGVIVRPWYYKALIRLVKHLLSPKTMVVFRNSVFFQVLLFLESSKEPGDRAHEHFLPHWSSMTLALRRHPDNPQFAMDEEVRPWKGFNVLVSCMDARGLPCAEYCHPMWHQAVGHLSKQKNFPHDRGWSKHKGSFRISCDCNVHESIPQELSIWI